MLCCPELLVFAAMTRVLRRKKLAGRALSARHDVVLDYQIALPPLSLTLLFQESSTSLVTESGSGT